MKFKRLLLVLIFVLPVSELILHLSEFPYTYQSNYSDLTITHFPNAVFLLSSLKNFGQIPLWSNAILSGYPFIANPLAGIWYPFGWLAYLFPLPAGFNLLTAIHLIWSAMGMFLLLKRMKINDFPSIAGALIFESLPRIWAHSAAGHLTLVYAFCWTPWLLWSEFSAQARSRWIPGIILALIALADVRWAAYAGLLWGAFRLSQSRALLQATPKQKRAWVFEFICQPVIGIALAAPLLIPLAEYTTASTRQGLSSIDSLVFSIEPVQLLGLLFPDVTGYVEWVLYPGAVCIVAFMWAWLDRDLRQKTRFVRWGIIVATFLSLGNHFSPAGWFLSLPGLNLLRVPPRFMLAGGFLFCLLAAIWMDHLIYNLNRCSIHYRAIRLGLVGLCSSTLVLTGVVWGLNSALPLTMIWGSLVYVFLSVVLFILMSKRLRSKWVGLAILCIGLLDTLTFDNSRMVFHKFDEVFSKGTNAAEYLKTQSKQFRVYSPSYSLPQQVAAFYGLELVDGIDPLQLRNYINFFEKASGIGHKGYSVTVPPFETATPEIDNQDIDPDPVLLGMLNVRFVVSEFDLNSEGLNLVARIDSTRIYENLKVLPRAWIQPDKLSFETKSQEIPVVFYSPNQIVLDATGPGLMVLSEIYYSGWYATVDGQEAAIGNHSGVFRAVELSPGKHVVKFFYQPDSVYIGLGIFALAMIGITIDYLNWRKHDLAK